MSYSKLQLFNDINELVERYVEQEISAMVPLDAEADVLVASDSEGDDIDIASGDIWDLENQEVIGQKDMQTGKKTWFDKE